jgi:hypothetical protein
VRVTTAALAAVIAPILAGCGGDEGSTTDAKRSREPKPEQTTPEAKLSPKQEIEQIGNKWAPLFASAPNPGACGEYDELHPYREVAAKYMAQPACEQLVCARVATGPIKNCKPIRPRSRSRSQTRQSKT